MGERENVSFSDIMELLPNLKVLDSYSFSKCFDIFIKEVNKQEELEDSLCIMATYLSYMPVTITHHKMYGLMGKKKQLLEYVMNHFSECSFDVQNYICDYQDKMRSIYQEQKRLKEEFEVREKYPDIYQELLELRTMKKVKSLKHE